MIEAPFPVISYSVTRTINLGNYESVRVQAGLSMSADGTTKQDVGSAYSKCRSFVDNRIDEEVAKWKNQ